MPRHYTLDGREVPWHFLIDEAAHLDEDFSRQLIQTTSEATHILREAGHQVYMREDGDA